MPSQKQNLYERAGITDLAEFYGTKFVSDEVLDAALLQGARPL